MGGETPIRVTIFDDSSGEHCPSGCGDSIDFVTEYLKEKYGEAVEVEYLNLAQPAVRRRNPEIIARIEEQGLLLPLVAINGRLKLSGNMEYRAIVEAIETLKEVGGG